MPSSAIRVLLVEPHELVRDALALRLDREPDLVVVDAVGCVEDALAAYDVGRHDLVVTEQDLPGSSGLELVRELRDRAPDVRVVMLTARDDRRLVTEAVRTGIAGLVRKRWATAVLVGAVRSVAEGACVLDREALDVLAAACIDPGDLEPLSAREVEVLHCLAEGLTNAQIGARLFVSRETVKSHVAHLLRKLGVEDRAAAARRGRQLGLVA